MNMPQEFHVLRCYSCSAFQVHIVKKSTKWQCKVCNEKQSLKQVYGQGTGKDCRNHVQRLNTLRITAEQDSAAELCEEDTACIEASNGRLIPGSQLSVKQVAAEYLCEENEMVNPKRPQQVSGSKWSQFLDPKKEHPVSSDDERDEVQPIKKQKTSLRGRQASKCGPTLSHPQHRGWQSLRGSEYPEQDNLLASKEALEVAAASCSEESYATQPNRSIQVDTKLHNTKPKNSYKGKWGKYCVDDSKRVIEVDFDDDSIATSSDSKCLQEKHSSNLTVQRDEITKCDSGSKYSNRWSKYLVSNEIEDNKNGSQGQVPVPLAAVVSEPVGSSEDEGSKVNCLGKKPNNLYDTDDLNDQELDQLLQL